MSNSRPGGAACVASNTPSLGKVAGYRVPGRYWATPAMGRLGLGQPGAGLPKVGFRAWGHLAPVLLAALAWAIAARLFHAPFRALGRSV